MKYVVKEILPHPLRLDNSCNTKFPHDFKKFPEEGVVKFFSRMCVDFFIKISSLISKVKLPNVF